MNTPRKIAKTMLEEAKASNLPLTNLKLHKLLYLAHGLMLATKGRPLVAGEHFAAWKYGPVLDSLYHDLKTFGSSPIDLNSKFMAHWESLPSDAPERAVIRSVLKQFGAKSAGALVDITHQPGGPWDTVFNELTTHTTIDDDDIERHFKKHLKAA